MVRHEAAEALGSIGDAECLELLKQQCTDPEPIVADSCVVRGAASVHVLLEACTEAATDATHTNSTFSMHSCFAVLFVFLSVYLLI